MIGKIHPIRVKLRCGAYAYLTRFDPDCLWPYWITVPLRNAQEYGISLDAYSVGLDGMRDPTLEKTPEDVTHYFVGCEKRMIELLDLRPKLEVV